MTAWAGLALILALAGCPAPSKPASQPAPPPAPARPTVPPPLTKVLAPDALRDPALEHAFTVHQRDAAPGADFSQATLEICPLCGWEQYAPAVRRRALAVMIENHRRARPQTGLNEADWVYEILSEGQITRFMAIFLHGDPRVLGPVRSAREYFVDLSRSFQAVYVHCGYSPQALEFIQREKVPTINQFSWGSLFWRLRERKAPHNLYTDAWALRANVSQRGLEAEPPAILPFIVPNIAEPTAATGASGGTPCTWAALDFSGLYQVRYQYDPVTRFYTRFMDDVPHFDGWTGELIRVRNLAVMEMSHRFVDDHSRRGIQTFGRGRAWYLSGGEIWPGTWERMDSAQPPRFKALVGTPAFGAGGLTWIQVVPIGREVKVLFQSQSSTQGRSIKP